jgi:hypothetical protein
MSLENIEKKEIEIQPEQTKTKTRLWFAVGAIFFLTSIILAIISYKFIWPKFINESQLSKLTGGNAGDNSRASQNKDNQPNIELVRRLIDGVYVEAGTDTNYPVAVMIENHVDSRPPSSLSEANLVFEAEAEGAVTRFLAIYADGKNLEEIGPVRSARPYYVDWAHEFNAVYSHCGGSPDALAKIIQEGIIDMNEFYNGKYFWRGEERLAPHNVYTSSANLQKYVIDKGLTDIEYSSWNYKDDAPEDLRPATSTIHIGFRSKDFLVDWKYNKVGNIYERYMAGEPHTDKSGQAITAKNVLIEYTTVSDIDEKARLTMKVTGSGQAVICRDGQCEKGKWKKPSESARTRFYISATSTDSNVADNEDKEAELNAGTTWVEVVRPTYDITY